VSTIRLGGGETSILLQACAPGWTSPRTHALTKSRMAGFLMIARAMAIRCFCPPESWLPRCPTSVFSPSGKAMQKS